MYTFPDVSPLVSSAWATLNGTILSSGWLAAVVVVDVDWEVFIMTGDYTVMIETFTFGYFSNTIYNHFVLWLLLFLGIGLGVSMEGSNGPMD